MKRVFYLVARRLMCLSSRFGALERSAEVDQISIEGGGFFFNDTEARGNTAN